MTKQHKHTPEFEAQVVLELLTGKKSAAQTSREYGVKESRLSRWKQDFIERSPELFESGAPHDDRDQRIAGLERKIKRVAMDMDTEAPEGGLRCC